MTQPMDRLTELRLDFDQTFAMPPSPPGADRERLIGLRLGGEPYALRLAACAGLVSMPQVVPLAGVPADCLGVAALRGRLVPIFALSGLLGHAGEAPRWLALTEGAGPIALAFAELDGYLEAPLDAFHPAAPGPAGYPVTTVCRGDPTRSIIEVSLLHEILSRAAGLDALHEEILP